MKRPSVAKMMQSACEKQILIPAFNIAYLPMMRPVARTLERLGTFGLAEVAMPDVTRFGAKSFDAVAAEYRKEANPEFVALHLDHVPVIDEEHKRLDWEKLIRKGLDLGLRVGHARRLAPAAGGEHRGRAEGGRDVPPEGRRRGGTRRGARTRGRADPAVRGTLPDEEGIHRPGRGAAVREGDRRGLALAWPSAASTARSPARARTRRRSPRGCTSSTCACCTRSPACRWCSTAARACRRNPSSTASATASPRSTSARRSDRLTRGRSPPARARKAAQDAVAAKVEELIVQVYGIAVAGSCGSNAACSSVRTPRRTAQTI